MAVLGLFWWDALRFMIAVQFEGVVLAGRIVAGLLALRDSESFQIPPVISEPTYAIAALVVAAAGLGSALRVRRRVDRLDLVAVLKTRE